MNSKLKKILALVLAVSASAGALAGCSGDSSASSSSAPAASGSSAPASSAAASKDAAKDSGDVPTIEWLAYQTSAQPDPNSEIIKKVEEMFGAKFNFWYIDDQNWDQTLNVKLAGGTMPDVMRIKTISALPNYIKQGVVEELPLETIQEKAPGYFKLISEYDTEKTAWDTTTYEGKNYGFIGLALDGTYASVVAYRKDWMDKVGVSAVPKTLDEYKDLMYKFRNEDPDGNGAKDTYGLSNRAMRSVLGAYGVSYNEEEKELKSVLKDGVPVYSAIQPEAKEALAVLAQWYKDGVIDPEFITGENTGGYWGLSHAFINGKIGSSVGAFYHFNAPYAGNPLGGQNYKEIKAVNPAAEVVSGLSPVGPDGKSGMPGSGPFREPIAITSQAHKDPRKVDIILSMLDKMYTDDEYATLIRYGIEGQHFEMKDGALSDITKLDNPRTIGLHIFNFLCVPPQLQKGVAKAKYEYADQVAKGPFYQQLSIPATEVMGKNATTLWTMTEEAYAKIITGEQPVDYFETFVEQFNKNGGADSTQSMQESYASLKSGK